MSLDTPERICFETPLKRKRILMPSIKHCWQITLFRNGSCILYIRVLDAGNNNSLAAATISALTSRIVSHFRVAVAAPKVAPEVMTLSIINIRLSSAKRTLNGSQGCNAGGIQLRGYLTCLPALGTVSNNNSYRCVSRDFFTIPLMSFVSLTDPTHGADLIGHCSLFLSGKALLSYK